jgi:hypothetical protein
MSQKTNRPGVAAPGAEDCNADERQQRNPAPIKTRRKVRQRGPTPEMSPERRAWLAEFWRVRDAQRALWLLRGDAKQFPEAQELLARHNLTEKEARDLLRKRP